ncbi:asparaginase [Chromobacterium sp. Panama]|uniref:asparaginase n=1 Tax=Chromobacterium sp. Panama TaxID=2161826 RepID=UPI000D314E77|nr:asparaginase [Chromobacterium sp. Panama]PTU64213.1 asparaginase [Chromobacterium sp. Panama]
MTLPRVLIITTGGTIAMTPNADGGISPSLTGEELIRVVPELELIAAPLVQTYSNKPGASLSLTDLAAIAALIEVGFTQGCSGAVVIQGTDTIEETAFALELLVRSPRPVVVTGAMRGAQAPGADGAANILAAVTVAASDGAKSLGALIVMGDQIHAARYVQKAHTAQPSAFSSPICGPLGGLVEGQLRWFARIEKLPALALPKPAETAIALLTIALGDDGRLLPTLPALGYQGVVIAAMGAGHVPAHIAPLIGDLCAHMPVVLSTRVVAGPVLSASYAFPGSETDLIGRGAIPGGALGALKACMLLRLLLAGGVPASELPAEFALRSQGRLPDG